jgi:hypothetical protein
MQHYIYSGQYLYVGCCLQTCDTSSAGRSDSWLWADDGDLKLDGSWSGSTGNSFDEGDIVGVLVDTDARIMQFTYDGTLLDAEVCMLLPVCI